MQAAFPSVRPAEKNWVFLIVLIFSWKTAPSCLDSIGFSQGCGDGRTRILNTISLISQTIFFLRGRCVLEAEVFCL